MGRQRFSVQYEGGPGEWIHHRAAATRAEAITLCTRLAQTGRNARVKDTEDWGGPVIAYRDAIKRPNPPTA